MGAEYVTERIITPVSSEWDVHGAYMEEEAHTRGAQMIRESFDVGCLMYISTPPPSIYLHLI